MEETKTTKLHDLYELFIKLIPYIILIFVILMTGLSFIAPFFEISFHEGDELIVKSVGISTLLFERTAGISVHIYFICHYIVLPSIACVLLIFSKNHHYFKSAAVIIFLVIAISSIVTKDSYADAIYFYYKVTTGVKYDFEVSGIKSFCYVLPIITYFVAFILSIISNLKHITFTVKDITEMGVLIAIAFGLNFIKLFQMPTGGSVNFQMLPLFFLALRRGPLKGFIGGGIVYGLITCLTDGWGFASYPFDYLLGFGSIAVFGFFSHLILVPGERDYTVRGELWLLLAGTISTSIRFIAGTVSSMVIYGYDLVAAMSYNSLYIFISGAISLAVLMGLLGPIRRINYRFPVIDESDL